ncbi:MAG: MFS transporter [Firmicutes bacterium]|jgi:MFS family permease|nr:MFS transporter [Bacillota bacterium]
MSAVVQEVAAEPGVSPAPIIASKTVVSRRDARRNYLIFFVDGFGFPLGLSVISASTIIPLLLTQLGASNLVIGLIPALQNLGSMAPGILVAPFIERVPFKRRWLVGVGIGERLVILSVAFAIMALGASRPDALIAYIIGAWTLFHTLSGINLPSYFCLVSKCIPAEQRGGLYGWSGAVGGVLGVLGAQAAGVILVRTAFPTGFAWLFAIAFVVLTATLIPFLWTVEPRDVPSRDRRTLREYSGAAARMLRTDSNLAGVIAALGLMSFALTATSFYSTYAVRVLGAGAIDVARFTAVSIGVTVVTSPLLGRVADRHGHRTVLEMSAASFAAAAALAFLAQSVAAVYVVLGLAYVGMSGLAVSQTLILTECAPSHQDVIMYTSVSWLLLAPVRTVAPIVAGWISDALGFGFMFGVTLGAGLLTMAVLRLWAREPRAAQGRTTQPW